MGRGRPRRARPRCGSGGSAGLAPPPGQARRPPGIHPDHRPDRRGILPAWEAYFGAVWASKNPEAKFGTFSAADLANFDTIVSLYAKLVSGISGLPMRFLGQATTNPPSAEGLLADESRIIKQVEDFQTTLEAAWERVMRIAVRIRDGAWDPRMRQLETQWRSAATPTKAQAADAAVKLKQAGILPVEATWVELGYSAARRAKLKEMLDAERAQNPLADIARGLADNGLPPAGGDPAAVGEPAASGDS
jgi:hypothetical protein